MRRAPTTETLMTAETAPDAAVARPFAEAAENTIGPASETVQAEGHARPTADRSRATIMHTWLFRPEATTEGFDVADLPALVADDVNLAWVDLAGYTATDLDEIAALLRLHPIGVRVALSAWQRPRLDLFGGHFFLSATVAGVEPRAYRVTAGELDLFVGRNFLLSVHKQPLPFLTDVLARARGNPDVIRLDSAFLLYILLDELIAHYNRLMEHLEDEIERMEERALHDVSEDFLEDLLRLKRYVFALARLADQHRPVFAAFTRPDFPFIDRDDLDVYFRDLQARLEQVVERLFAAREAVNGAFDIYVSHMSHRTNDVMKVLTVVSTVLLPISVILAFFGVSFQDEPMFQSELVFWMMVASVVTVPAVTLWILRGRGWM